MSEPTGEVPAVRCVGCGCLALRPPESGEHLEADAVYRQEGVGYGKLRQGAESGPVCLAMAADLRAERIARIQEHEPGRTLAVIQQPRRCLRFLPWKQGFSPKEHIEMMYADELRKFRDEQRAKDLAWQEQQSELARAFRREILAEEHLFRNRQQWVERVWRLVIGVVSFAGGIAVTYLMATYLGLRPDGTPATQLGAPAALPK